MFRLRNQTGGVTGDGRLQELNDQTVIMIIVINFVRHVLISHFSVEKGNYSVELNQYITIDRSHS